ncbi:MAG: RecX family transcriptional regulator [Muribaculaceae bacterium]|nr:RecX family transcriptional regulator [Muribaculaceae bacterium]
MEKAVSVEAARLRMADLCARSEQCSYDIEQKLRRYGLDSDESAEVLAFLRENKFVDDGRFARSFARDKVRFTGWGPIKIRAALAAKRIGSADISEALKAVESSDSEEALQRALKAKVRNLDPNDRNDRQKALRYLMSRGFKADDCLRAVEKWRRENTE